MFKRGLGAGIGLRNTTSLINIPTIQTEGIAPPLSINLAPKQYHAFDMNRVVEGYGSDAIRLQRLSDNAQANFGFDNDGLLDTDAIDTWRNGADVDVVEMFDQTENGATCIAFGKITLITNNTYTYAGVDYNTDTGLLSRNAQGSVIMDLGGMGAWKISNTTIPVSTNGFEFHINAVANERRKDHMTTDTVVPAGVQDTQTLFYYGEFNNNWFNEIFGRKAFWLD